MEFQLGKSLDFIFLPQETYQFTWIEEFQAEFLSTYETAAQYEGEVGLPALDEICDFMNEFFYEVVSFREYGSRTAYMGEVIEGIENTDEEKEDFYEYAQNIYFWDFSLDLKTLVDRNHYSVFCSSDGYLNMPIKEVW